MARAAAATALLNRELDSLSHESIRTRRSVSDIDGEVANLGRNVQRSGREIDQYSGRLKLLAEAAAVLGPAFVPVGAVAIPAITGLASQLGFAALGAGTAVLAFHGLGDALKAVNKAALQPTTVNLEAARLALEKLPESAQRLVIQLRDMAPEFKKLQATAADGLLPGVSSALTDLEGALPRVEHIVSTISTALGEIAADTGESLASDRWKPFLEFIAIEAPSALQDLSSIVGSTAHGLAELWMAFTPLNNDFSTFLVKAADDFDHFAANLSKTNGFIEFTDYIRENGPQVGETFGALGNALVQITQAAAPLGGPVLKSVEALADALAAIANSDLGTPLFTAVAALSLFNRGLKTAEALSVFGGRLDRAGLSARRFGDNLNRANLAKSALLLGGLAVAGTGAADSIGLTNTASLGLVGTVGGPLGTALGAAAGFTLDLAHANDQVAASLNQARAAAESNSIAQVKAAQAALLSRASDLASGNSFNDNVRRISAFIAGNDESLAEQSHTLDIRLRELQSGPLQGVGSLLTQGLGTPARQAALDLDGAATASDRFANSLAGLNTKLQQSQNMVAFRDSIRDLNDVVKNNPLGTSLGTGLGKQGAQGDAVRSQLLTIIQLTLQAASGLKAADQIGFLRRARADILERAKDLGLPLAAVTKLLNAFGVVDRTKVTPKVDTKEFDKGITHAKTSLDKFLDGDYKVKIQPYLTNPGKKGGLDALLLQPLTPADGTTVPGARFPYGDSVPALLSPGEEVISNRFGQADRHRELLKQINANRMGHGGTVQRVPGGGGPVASSGLTAADLQAVATLIAAARPLYGDVHLQPHNYNQFLSGMEQDRRMSSSDGVQR